MLRSKYLAGLEDRVPKNLAGLEDRAPKYLAGLLDRVPGRLSEKQASLGRVRRREGSAGISECIRSELVQTRPLEK